MIGLVTMISLASTAYAQIPINGSGRNAARIKSVEGMYSIGDEGRITISRIIGTYDLSAEESYNAVKKLIEGNLINANYGIVADEASNFRFAAEGYYDAFYQRKPGAMSGLGCHVDSRLRLEAKDNRIRITITILNYRNDAINVDARTIWPFNQKDKRDRNITGLYYVSEPVTVPKYHASRYFNAAVKDGNALLTEIENKLNQEKKDNEW